MMNELASAAERRPCGDVEALTTIRDVLHRFLLCIDTRDYVGAVRQLDERVHFDYRALNGEVLPANPTALIERVRSDHRLIDGIEHVVTNHVIDIDGDRATCWVNFAAMHCRSDGEHTRKWALGGRYRYQFARREQGWKLSGCVITPIWETGDRSGLTESSPEHTDG